MIMVCSFGGRPNLWRPFDETIASLRPRVPADLHLLAQTYVDPVRSAMPVLDQLDAAISDLSAEADQWRVLIISSAAVHTDWLAGCREALRRVVSDGVQLAYGEHLRRARATIDARGYLSAALSTFEALGARPWAIRPVTSCGPADWPALGPTVTGWPRSPPRNIRSPRSPRRA